MLTIKVLGPGCANCQKVEVVTKKAVNEMGMEAEMIKITKYAEIMEYPIISTPGLVINEKLVCAGRIPTQAEVTSWLANAMMAASEEN
jgi:small redox-active disulfide protein 2